MVSEDRGRAVDPRARVDQIRGVELVPAVVALVAARAPEAADRARALDVAVGKRMPGRGGERAERLLLDDEALLVERAEEVARDAVVVLGRRPREEVVGQPEIAEILANERVEALGGLTRRLSRGVRRDHDRRAVLVGAADHEHVVAAQPVVAGERVRRHSEARHMADMARPARIRPRHRDQDLPRCRPLDSCARMIWSRLRDSRRRLQHASRRIETASNATATRNDHAGKSPFAEPARTAFARSCDESAA